MALPRISRNSTSLIFLGHLAAIITICCWGASFIASKVLMTEGGFTPTETFIYRFAAAYIVLLCFTFKRILSNNWKDELCFFVCGICAGSLYFIAENYALTLTATANVSLLAGLSPIFTTILIAIIYHTHIGIGVYVGSLIAFVGVGCIIFSTGEGFEIHPLGDIIALMAALSWGIYSVVVKRVLPFYSSFFVTRKLFFYGVITALPLLLLQDAPLHLGLFFDFEQPKFLLSFLFLVIMCSLTAYIIWNEAMKILGPVTTNNYLYGQPLVTMIVAYFVLDERIMLLGGIGCILIIGGLVLADKWKTGSDPERS